MGSRLTPVSLALGALAADAAGVHGLASFLVLVAVVGAAAAAFGAVAAVLAGHGSRLVAVTTGVALALLLVGSAVRFGAPVGEAPPTLALSTLVLAGLCYAVPLVSWLLAPPAPKPRLRTEPSN